ncbi:MAG: hypothetical protein Q8935_23490, partial [Bacillota bacterium]|nr:hypothetical protein [Bacillota bacterium]
LDSNDQGLFSISFVAMLDKQALSLSMLLLKRFSPAFWHIDAFYVTQTPICTIPRAYRGSF